MIREYIKEQLSKCNFANVSNITEENGYSFIIPKYSKPKYILNKCYLIKVSDMIVNKPNSVTAVNWNNGDYPRKNYLKAYVSKTFGKMIFVDCLEYDFEAKKDLETTWSGWLSVDDITQIAELG